MTRSMCIAFALLSVSGMPVFADDAGYLGIVVGQLPPGAVSFKGALIQEIFEESPADRDGLRTGDLIVAVNDQEIMDAQGLLDVTKFLKSGDKARVKVQRAGEKDKKEFTVALTQRPAKPLAELPLKKRPTLGIAFAIQSDGQLSVAQFLPNSAAERAGFQAGDIIASIGGLETKGYAAVLSSLAAQKDGDNVTFQVLRNGVTQQITLELKHVAPQYKPKPS